MARLVRKKYPRVGELTPADHLALVREVFTTIPRRYDFLNRFFSLRRDVAWRRFAAGKMRFFKTMRFLDVATGTADLAIAAVRRNPQIRVSALDFVAEMMTVGRRKVRRWFKADPIDLIQADALSLPFGDDAFDVAAIAFGIRNIPDRLRALQEMKRVVVPGGQVLVLEMNFPRQVLFRRFYNLYLNRLMPQAARLFSKNPEAYRYLGDSIVNFPEPEKFAALMAQAGLTGIEKYSLTLGVTYLYIGLKAET
jgi:demethylmenaquinone methyltransferase/2-methoxy-6-polyprenyl-1,4-benzoquinol methylase